MKYETTKGYLLYNLTDTSIFERGEVQNYKVPTEVLQKLSKDLGFSYDLYISLSAINLEASKSLLESMIIQSKKQEIVLLIDEKYNIILGYTLDASRYPILNCNFLNKINMIIPTSETLEVASMSYDEESMTSTVLIKRKTPIVVEEKYEGRESKFIDYEVGVMMLNNELESASCRLVLYVDGQPIYLPASLYSSSTTRYKRSTSDSLESLEILLLKIIEDFRGDTLLYKFQELHYRYRHNKSIIITYEEYNTVLNTLRKMPSVIEDNSILESLTSLYEDFERKYHSLEDQKSSYIWRCTAIGELSIENLIHKVCEILNTLYAPDSECLPIRDILGVYVSTPRIVEDIAKDSSL